MKKIYLFFTVTVLILISGLSGQSASSQLLQSGETLYYRVSYLGITLGYITVVTEGTEVLNGKEVYKTKGYMKSNPDIPFVDLKAIYQSWIDLSVSYSHKFVGKVKLSDDTWDYHLITYDYDKEIIRSQKWIREKLFFDNSFKTDKKSADGLSLFFLARNYIRYGKTLAIPTIVDRDTVITVINFMKKKEKSEIDAVDYNIKTIYFDGKAHWTGIYGMTGEFEGWFSDDEASIPIRATMEVYIGSINIELVKWKRNGWKPPKAD